MNRRRLHFYCVNALIAAAFFIAFGAAGYLLVVGWLDYTNSIKFLPWGMIPSHYSG